MARKLYVTREQIESASDGRELANYFWGFRGKIVAKKNQILLVQKAVEFEHFFILDYAGEHNQFTPEALDEIIKYPILISHPMMQSGFGKIVGQMSDDQIKKMLENIISEDGVYSRVWTHFYQKTLSDNVFRKDPRRTLMILNYLVVENKVHKFTDPQIISNIMEIRSDISQELIDWILEYGKDVSKIVGRMLTRVGKDISEEMLEYIYHNVRYTYIDTQVANLLLDRNSESDVLGTHYLKTKNEKYMPQKAKDIFMF